MFKKILLLAAVIFVIAGCGSNKPRVAPRNPLVTNLIIPLHTEKWELGLLQLATKNKNGCGEFAQNLLPDATDEDFTMGIEAGRDTFFHIARSDAKNKCDYFGIFYAGKGNDYILNIETKSQACVVTLIEKKLNGSQSNINTYPVHASKVDGVRVCENKDKLY